MYSVVWGKIFAKKLQKIEKSEKKLHFFAFKN